MATLPPLPPEWPTHRATLRRLSDAKIEHDYLVLRDDETLAKGHTVLAVLDREGTPQRATDHFQINEDPSGEPVGDPSPKPDGKSDA